MPNAPKVMYRSTHTPGYVVDRRTAILQSQPKDGGLYVPTFIPQFSKDEIKSLRGKSLPEVGYAVMDKYLRGSLPDEVIEDICRSALDFKIPVKRVNRRLYAELLGEGGSGAFKDTGAGFLAAECQYYVMLMDDGERWVLTSTSGDTGAAIAKAFYGKRGINAVILYPEKEVTATQAALMNSYGGNVIALACDGVFDDLQNIVKTAFDDKDLKRFKTLSANSINIGRALPQVIHAVYPLTMEEIMDSGDYPVFSVPSGNFGHAYAYIVAGKMGAYDGQLVIGNNSNDVFHRFMQTGEYEVRDTVKTISNAMNVRDPSNMIRIFDLYGGRLVKDREFIDKNGEKSTVCRIDRMPDVAKMRDDLWTFSVDDDHTMHAIRHLYSEHDFVAEPHTAVGAYALMQYLGTRKDDPVGVFVSTANSAKFPEVLREGGIEVEIPAYMRDALEKESCAIKMSSMYEDFKEFMISGEAENVIRKQKASI